MGEFFFDDPAAWEIGPKRFEGRILRRRHGGVKVKAFVQRPEFAGSKTAPAFAGFGLFAVGQIFAGGVGKIIEFVYIVRAKRHGGRSFGKGGGQIIIKKYLPRHCFVILRRMKNRIAVNKNRSFISGPGWIRRQTRKFL